MVTKATKKETVKNLSEKLAKASAVYTTDQLGLTVEEISILRKSLREVNAEYKIARNTLIGIAAKDTVYAELTKDLIGTTALLICYEDKISPAGKVKKFSKQYKNKIEFKAGLLDGELLDKTKVEIIADLPSKEVLLSQIAGLLVAAPVAVAYMLQELSAKGEGEQLLKEFVKQEEKSEE